MANLTLKSRESKEKQVRVHKMDAGYVRQLFANAIKAWSRNETGFVAAKFYRAGGTVTFNSLEELKTYQREILGSSFARYVLDC